MKIQEYANKDPIEEVELETSYGELKLWIGEVAFVVS